MRKSSKIFAVIFAICLLCGIVTAIAVSASAPTLDTMQNGDTVTITESVDAFVPRDDLFYFTVVAENGATFAISETVKDLYGVSEVAEGTTTIYTVVSRGYNDPSQLNVTKYYCNVTDTFNSQFPASKTLGYTLNGGTSAPAMWEYVTASGNSYYHAVFDPNAQPASATPSFKINFGYFAEDRFNATVGVKYLTVDFDFGTDRYVYRDASDTAHTAATLEEIPEEYRAKADLAFINRSSYVCLEYRTSTGINKGYLYTVKDTATGLWYLSQDNAYNEGDILMSNRVGDFDHITYVAEIAYTETGADLLNSKLYVYVNGVYAYEEVLGAEGRTADEFRFQTIYLGSSSNSHHYDSYAFAVDNVATNSYKEGKNDTYIATLDSYFAGDYTNSPLYELDCVVYNRNYHSPNGVFGIKGGQVTSIPALVESGIAGISDGDDVFTTIDILNYKPADSVKKFTVSTLDGAKFSLSNLASLVYKTSGTDTVTVEKSGLSGTKANVTLFGEMDFNYYVPKLDGVTLEVTDNDVTVKDAEIDEVSYYCITWRQNAASLTAKTLTLTLKSAEGTVSFDTTLDTLKYAGLVAKEYSCGTKEAKLVKAIADYKKAAYTLDIGGNYVSSNPEVEELENVLKMFASHPECTCGATFEIGEEEKAYNMDALKDKIEYAEFMVAFGGESGLVLQLKDGASKYNDLKVTYEKLNDSNVYETAEATVVFVDNGHVEYYVISLDAAYINAPLTITADGAVGNYSLAAYIGYLQGNAEYDEFFVVLAESMYKYALTAFDYKHTFTPAE